MNLLDAIAERLRRSWWSHSKGKEIFRALDALPEDQVVSTKLVGGKVTLIHRRLWPELLAVAIGGTARLLPW
jgi:hypothetical protein